MMKFRDADGIAGRQMRLLFDTDGLEDWSAVERSKVRRLWRRS